MREHVSQIKGQFTTGHSFLVTPEHGDEHHHCWLIFVCQENVLEMIINFFLVFFWCLPGTISQRKLFNSHFLRKGYYAESAEERSVCHGNSQVSRGLEGIKVSSKVSLLPRWEGGFSD